MTWSTQEVSKFQLENNRTLAEINDTLRPDKDLGDGKIGIFLFGQVGDLATAMSVLAYRKELWPGKKIIWFANAPNADLLKYAPISEVRPWPWAGNGLPEGTPDFYPLLCNGDNHLDLEKASKYDLTKDLDNGYFPAPHMHTPEQRDGIDYPNISRKVFGIDKDKPWHPVLSFSEDEKLMVSESLLPLRKTIMIETYCGSKQSVWDDLFTIRTIELCREKWGSCNFLFCSHKNTEGFKDFEGYHSLADFTPRQAALFIEHCDLFVGISSGLSVVTSYLGSKPVPKIQCCGSYTCSTVALSTGEINLITSDGHQKPFVLNQFELKLKEVIERIG